MKPSVLNYRGKCLSNSEINFIFISFRKRRQSAQNGNFWDNVQVTSLYYLKTACAYEPTLAHPFLGDLNALRQQSLAFQYPAPLFLSALITSIDYRVTDPPPPPP